MGRFEDLQHGIAAQRARERQLAAEKAASEATAHTHEEAVRTAQHAERVRKYEDSFRVGKFIADTLRSHGDMGDYRVAIAWTTVHKQLMFHRNHEKELLRGWLIDKWADGPSWLQGRMERETQKAIGIVLLNQGGFADVHLIEPNSYSRGSRNNIIFNAEQNEKKAIVIRDSSEGINFTLRAKDVTEMRPPIKPEALELDLASFALSKNISLRDF